MYVPTVFRQAAAPFELVAGKEQGCLCTNCFTLEQFRHGQATVVSALDKIIARCRNCWHFWIPEGRSSMTRAALTELSKPRSFSAWTGLG
mmetsp:Transcript_15245/g.22367  ORF Transcript_15245/g.22367 Transcript_15245/m.22367 type:complete len:90 (-) Transcript_15245:574-843(-)